MGVQLINQLPRSVTLPDRTAAWEKQLDEISKGKKSPVEFMNSIVAEYTPMVKNPVLSDMSKIKRAGQHDCPETNCNGELKRIPKKDEGYFWGCNKKCGFTTNDSRGKPAKKVLPSTKYLCPNCNNGLIKRKGPENYFWGCSEWKAGCKFTAKDNRNKPILD